MDEGVDQSFSHQMATNTLGFSLGNGRSNMSLQFAQGMNPKIALAVGAGVLILFILIVVFLILGKSSSGAKNAKTLDGKERKYTFYKKQLANCDGCKVVGDYYGIGPAECVGKCEGECDSVYYINDSKHCVLLRLDEYPPEIVPAAVDVDTWVCDNCHDR